jgi:hypothetical protein
MRIGIAAPRFAAAGVAALAWAGLTLQFLATSTHSGSPAKALWFLADYFTILTNFAVAVVFTGLAFGRDDWDRSRLLAGLTLAGLLSATIYALLLRGLDHPYGAGQAANILLHIVVPILVTLFWLVYVRKGALQAGDPFAFAVFPLAYLVYALARGHVEGRYPYLFLNVARIGLHRTLANAGAIGLGFLLGGYGLFLLDRLLSGQARRR